MPFDFDPFSDLDMNHDFTIDETDLETYSLVQGENFSIDDVNSDNILDAFQHSLNGNVEFDEFEVDLDKNSVMDSFEKAQFGPKFDMDLNHDDTVDETDEALARYYFNK